MQVWFIVRQTDRRFGLPYDTHRARLHQCVCLHRHIDTQILHRYCTDTVQIDTRGLCHLAVIVCVCLQTATYTFRNTAELVDYQEGRYGSYEYGRYGNPTTRACEEKIRVSPRLLLPLLWPEVRTQGGEKQTCSTVGICVFCRDFLRRCRKQVAANTHAGPCQLSLPAGICVLRFAYCCHLQTAAPAPLYRRGTIARLRQYENVVGWLHVVILCTVRNILRRIARSKA